MKIRVARKDDIEGVLQLIHRFVDEGLDELGLFCDDKLARKVMEGFAEAKRSLVLIVDGQIIGILAGIITEFPLTGEKIFSEKLFYIVPEQRKYSTTLIETLEERCTHWNIAMIIMTSFGYRERELLERYYNFRGYKYLETHFIKRLNGADSKSNS